MTKLVVMVLLTSTVAFGQDCLPLGKTLSLGGRLVLINANGYWQWVGLQLPRPVCVQGDRGDGVIERVDAVEMMQTSDVGQRAINSRLNRLIGNSALLTGTLTQWLTGYQQAAVVLEVQAVEPVDEQGKAALRTPEAPRPDVRVVRAYDVTIRTADRLEKLVRETATGQVLTPADEYAPHWMTGQDVLWANCRDGYELRSSNITPRNLGQCGAPENSCGLIGLTFLPHRVVTLKMHCVKQAR
jgi:hypothetical protein